MWSRRCRYVVLCVYLGAWFFSVGTWVVWPSCWAGRWLSQKFFWNKVAAVRKDLTPVSDHCGPTARVMAASPRIVASPVAVGTAPVMVWVKAAAVPVSRRAVLRF